MALQDIEVKAKELDLEIQKLSELTDAGNLMNSSRQRKR